MLCLILSLFFAQKLYATTSRSLVGRSRNTEQSISTSDNQLTFPSPTNVATAPETSHFSAGDPLADWPQGIMSSVLWRLSLVDQTGHLFGRCAQVACCGCHIWSGGRRASRVEAAEVFHPWLLIVHDQRELPTAAHALVRLSGLLSASA